MIREASAVGNSGALPANGETSPHGHNNNSSAELDDDDLSPHGDKDEVVLQLAQTKVSLAQVEGKLAEARRDLSRMRELNNALNTRIESLTEERDKSWEDVRFLAPLDLVHHCDELCFNANSITAPSTRAWPVEILAHRLQLLLVLGTEFIMVTLGA